MTFALTASKPLEVEGFEAGAVATHTPRGDGNPRFQAHIDRATDVATHTPRGDGN